VKRTAAQAIVDALVAEGVDTIFGLPGSHVLAIYDVLRDTPSIRHITCKHENSAAIMAQMVGRLTGRPGVALVTAGPGATNSLSGVVEAFAASAPMIHISGTVPLDSGNETFHGVDKPDFLYKMFKDVTKWTVRVERAADIPAIFSKAFSLAASGRPGPVHIEVPLDIVEQEAVPMPTYQVKPARRQGVPPAFAAKVATILKAARAPVICAGAGVLRAEASAELVQLAEALSAPVIHTMWGTGVIPDDHPLSAAAMHHWRQEPLVNKLLEKADVLLTVGVRPGSSFIHNLERLFKGKHILVGFDEPKAPADGALKANGDARLSLQALLAALKGYRRPTDKAVLDEIARYRRGVQGALAEYVEKNRQRRPMHFGVVMHALAPMLARDAIVVADVGNSEVWARQYLPVYGPTSYIEEGSWGEMGFALAGAIAAKLVHPERQVIGIIGDGAFLMAGMDFVTAAQYGANVVYIVLNDSAYGMINYLQQERYDRIYASELGRTNFAQLAESQGAVGLRVEDPNEVPSTLRRALEAARRSPVLVDVVAGWDFPFLDMTKLAQEAGVI